MNIKLILIWFIAVLLVVGAGLGLYLMLAKPATVETPAATPAQNTPTDSSVTVPTHVQSTGDPSLDLDNAYTSLFNKIGAQRVSFVPVASANGEVGSVYALYSADVALAKKTFPKLTTFPINIALIDLNKDGAAEAIIWENLPGVCGSSGCPLEVYTKVSGTWTLLYSGQGGSTAGVSRVYTSGYADILLPITGDVAYQSKIVKYSWNGTKYAPNGVVATWDGTQFNQ